MLIKSLLSSKKYSSSKIPIWFMRQAGRYLPEYRKLRSKYSSFLDICFSPKIAAEISLQPIKRFDLDGIILFSDILVIPHALGQKVNFKENIGPILKPIETFKDLKKNTAEEWDETLNPIYETVDILKKKKKDKTLIGFCGSPFTVLTYMIEGQTSKTHRKTKLFLLNYPDQSKIIIKKLIDISIHYLSRQIEAGVDVVQLFESWSGILEKDLFEEYIVKPNRKIVERLKQKYNIPIILFPRNSGIETKQIIKKIKLDGLSIDLKTPNKILKLCKKEKIIVQGRLDPLRLLVGGKQMEKEIEKIILSLKNNRLIFNLSHGILPETPINNVEQMIKKVRSYEVT